MRALRPVNLAGVLFVTALGGCNSDDTQGPSPVPTDPPTIESFRLTTADGRVRHGDWATLRWRAPGATSGAITPDIGIVSSPERGSASIRPHESVTYTLTVRNAHGTVSATLDVEVWYRAGLYVDAVDGDDGNAGDAPARALATLGEALTRTRGGGTIFLSGGTYTSPISIDGAQVSIYGGLDPATFFDDPETFVTTVRPSGGEPLSIRNTLGTMEISHLVLDTRSGGRVAGEVVDAQARFLHCTFDAREGAAETALSIEGSSTVEVVGCRIFASRPFGGGTPHAETRGVRIVGAAGALLANCFIDGGRAIQLSSGVDVETSGTVRLGLNTISAQIESTGGPENSSAAVRIRQGHPAIGGNILFTLGNGQRFGVLEEVPGTSPSMLEGNLFISVGAPPYGNADGADPMDEKELNDPAFTVGVNRLVFGNLLVLDVGAPTILERAGVSDPNRDYHLVQPLPSGGANPAVDRGSECSCLAKEDYGGSFLLEDIDGDDRPSSFAAWDLGADELR